MISIANNSNSHSCPQSSMSDIDMMEPSCSAGAGNSECFLEELQAMNTLANEHVEYQEYAEAIPVFTTMLAQLSTCLLTPTPIGGSQKPLNDRMTVYCATDPSEEEDSKLDPRQVEFYTRPFQWECSSVDDPDDDCQQSSSSEVSSEEYNVIAVTALFNLGLCYHWQWQQAQQQQQQAPPKLAAGHNSSSCTLEHLLQQALYAYEQAFLLTSAYDCPPALLPVLLGVCANATHVHIELAQARTAALWNQRLTSTLRLYLSQSPSPVDPAARKFFSLQAFFQSFPRHAASAA